MTESSEKYSHTSELIELVFYCGFYVNWRLGKLGYRNTEYEKKKRSKKLLPFLNRVFDQFLGI